MNYKELIDKDNIPRHIGIIMDGNGRWAKKRSMPRSYGHKAGSDKVIEVVESCYNLGVEALTLYAFSTENWKRPSEEISKLMDLLIFYVKTQLAKIKKNNIKINVLGDYSKFPDRVVKEITKALKETASNDKMILNIALNYGGQQEIVRATKNIYKDIENGKITLDDVDINSFKNYLYTCESPDLDLLIRPSGELRVSNFLLYQLAYSEFYFSNVLWPDFDENELCKAIYSFQSRDRRFGGL
ncbi:isoprenyl transferase [Peptoniphilus sp.]|jgi:undecaprenyl diphosphate synthase|uniref:isoprenyl transferase n=1 Tax=Peptoniphilus sp. TaxID=1971214 RepID=UPI003D92E436